MQQRVNPIEALADLPVSKPLAKAREALEEVKQVEASALAAFRQECARINARGSVMLDVQASQAEREAIKAGAATRLAHQECERLRQDHGVQLSNHLARHEADCLSLLTSALQEAQELAAKLAKAIDAAQRDGGHPSHKLGKVSRVAADLAQAIKRLS